MYDHFKELTSTGGAFSWQRASKLGLVPSDIRTLTRSGAAKRVRRGAFVATAAWDGAPPEVRLAMRARAIMAGRTGDVAVYQSALAMYRLPVHGMPADVVDVANDVSRVRLRSGLRVHPRGVCGGAELMQFTDGAIAVEPAYALAQVILRTGGTAAIVSLDAALHRRLATRSEVQAALAALAANPTELTRGTACLALADQACESVGESLLRMILHAAGLEYRTQVDLPEDGGGWIARVDFLVSGLVVVEFDGLVKYRRGDKAGKASDPSLVVIREKRREDAIRELHYGVVRVVWRELDDPGDIVRRIREAVRVERAAR